MEIGRTALLLTTAIAAIPLRGLMVVHRHPTVIPLRAPTPRLVTAAVEDRTVAVVAVPMAAVVAEDPTVAVVITEIFSDLSTGPFRIIQNGPFSFFLTRRAHFATPPPFPQLSSLLRVTYNDVGTPGRVPKPARNCMHAWPGTTSLFHRYQLSQFLIADS
jgi:hypothetical protein